MGEQSAREESILGDFVGKEANIVKAIRLSNTTNLVHLYIFVPDNLKYVQSKAFEYEIRNFDSAQRATPIFESISGETKHGY
jgi:hypothetical protein